VDIVGRRTLDQVIEWSARGREGEVFILLADGSMVTFRDFLAQGREAGAILRAHGVRRSDAVLLHMPTSLCLVALMFGIYRLGAVAAMSNPVNTARAVAARRARAMEPTGTGCTRRRRRQSGGRCRRCYGGRGRVWRA